MIGLIRRQGEKRCSRDRWLCAAHYRPSYLRSRLRGDTGVLRTLTSGSKWWDVEVLLRHRVPPQVQRIKCDATLTQNAAALYAHPCA